MRWTVLNALGGFIWLAGIICAKGATGLAAPYAAGHNVAVGLAMGAMGLALLLWANLRSAN